MPTMPFVKLVKQTGLMLQHCNVVSLQPPLYDDLPCHVVAEPSFHENDTPCHKEQLFLNLEVHVSSS